RALDVADRAFDAAAEGAASARPRALLVVSDGEDHEGGLAAAADALRDDGVTILALGVGTEAGAPVPDVRRGRVVGNRRTRGGEPVVSRFEPGALEDLAGRSGLYRLGRTGAVAPEIGSALDGLDRAVLDASDVSAEAERFQWPLALAVLLLLAERGVALRVGRRTADRGPQTEPASGATASLENTISSPQRGEAGRGATNPPPRSPRGGTSPTDASPRPEAV
ncbi:MAG: hypothetical protein AAF845_17140, partial [Bacteroidota bacterium]